MENENQPAFPPNAGWEHSEAKGLTKREYLAAMAMQGIISSMHSPETRAGEGDPVMVAKDSVNYADALLKQLDS